MCMVICARGQCHLSSQQFLTKLDVVQRMQEAEAEAARNARLVHAITYQEAIAGIFKPPPSEHRADFLGLFLNCVVAGKAPMAT